MGIPIPKSENTDIYQYGFDQNLNVATLDMSTPSVYNSMDQTASQNITLGSLYTGAGNNNIGIDPAQGIWLGNAKFANAPFSVTEAGVLKATAANIAGTITASTGTIGGFTINSDNINDAANSMGLASTVTGADDVRFWAGSTFANRATAPFRVTEAGAVTGSSVTITGGSVSSTPISSIPNNTSTDISLLNFSHNLAFTSASATQINWSAGTIVMSNGRTFTISSGNTGVMAAATYIYLDTGVSSTVLQTTTTYSTSNGANKILIATAQNNTVAASVVPFGGGQPVLDGVGNIAAVSITAASIAASTITGGNIATMNISGKNATFDTGSIGGFTMSATQLTATNFSVTSGAANTANLSVGTGSNLGGLNSGNASGDIAFWAGDTFANRATAPFRVTMGGAVTATSATISGYVISSKGAFGGDGSDGALTITSGTTTVDLGSAAIVIKNYTSISITGTGALAFSNPHANGTIIILKSQGNVTVTSSATAAIDITGMGSAIGTGGAGGINAQNSGTSASNTTTNQGLVATTAATFGVFSSGGGTAGTGFNFTNWSLTSRFILLQSGGGGSGGGSGGAGGGLLNGAGGDGGRGAGCLYCECRGALNITGAMKGVGGNATAGTNASGGGPGGGGGGGGSGAGGLYIFVYNTLTANSTVFTVTAGTVGSATTGANNGGGAGAGGGNLTGSGSNGGTGNVGTGAGGVGGLGAAGSSLVTLNNYFA